MYYGLEWCYLGHERQFTNVVPFTAKHKARDWIRATRAHNATRMYYDRCARQIFRADLRGHSALGLSTDEYAKLIERVGQSLNGSEL